MERQNKNACHFTLCSSAAKYTVCGQRNNHSQTEEEAVKSAPWTALCHFNCTFVGWAFKMGEKKQATLLSGCLYGGGLIVVGCHTTSVVNQSNFFSICMNISIYLYPYTYIYCICFATYLSQSLMSHYLLFLCSVFTKLAAKLNGKSELIGRWLEEGGVGARLEQMKR